MAVNFIHRHEANIMALIGVFGTWISQSDDEKHGRFPPSS